MFRSMCRVDPGLSMVTIFGGVFFSLSCARGGFADVRCAVAGDLVIVLNALAFRDDVTDKSLLRTDGSAFRLADL
jgi:hypothetical protein